MSSMAHAPHPMLATLWRQAGAPGQLRAQSAAMRSAMQQLGTALQALPMLADPLATLQASPWEARRREAGALDNLGAALAALAVAVGDDAVDDDDTAAAAARSPGLRLPAAGGAAPRAALPWPMSTTTPAQPAAAWPAAGLGLAVQQSLRAAAAMGRPAPLAAGSAGAAAMLAWQARLQRTGLDAAFAQPLPASPTALALAAATAGVSAGVSAGVTASAAAVLGWVGATVAPAAAGAAPPSVLGRLGQLAGALTAMPSDRLVGGQGADAPGPGLMSALAGSVAAPGRGATRRVALPGDAPAASAQAGLASATGMAGAGLGMANALATAVAGAAAGAAAGAVVDSVSSGAAAALRAGLGGVAMAGGQGGQGGLRGLAARAAAAGAGSAAAAAPPQAGAMQAAADPCTPASAANPGSDGDDALLASLARALRREAERDGIDLGAMR